VAGALTGGWQEQVRQGVIALGWSAQQADQAVVAVADSIDGEVPAVPVLLRQAIRLLGRTR
jgi:Holliday junction DNA helicase RuvA